jgi:hypothetical protein
MPAGGPRSEGPHASPGLVICFTVMQFPVEADTVACMALGMRSSVSGQGALAVLGGNCAPILALGLTSGGAGVSSATGGRKLRVWDATWPEPVKILEFDPGACDLDKNSQRRAGCNPDLGVSGWPHCLPYFK